jgi:hypothetical protein
MALLGECHRGAQTPSAAFNSCVRRPGLTSRGWPGIGNPLNRLKYSRLFP